MALWDDDLDAFFNDFGVDASFSHAGGAASTVKVIFDNSFQSELGVETSGPVVTTKSTGVSTAVHGDTITISTVTYTITGVQPDGTGITLLLLSRE